MDFNFARSTIIPSRKIRWLIFHLALGFSCPITQQASEEPVVITSVAQYWNTQLPQNIPHQVRMEITVNYYDPYWNVLWAEADGLAFYVHAGDSPLPIKSGQRILLEGMLTPSKGIDVSKVKLTVLKQTGAWNKPLEAKGRLNDLKKFRDRWITVEGHVDRQSDVDANHVNYEITVEDRSVLVNLLLDSNDPVPQLKDTRVRLTGVLNAAVGAKNTINLWIPSHEFIETLGPIANDPRFDQTPMPIENLLGAPENEMVTIAGDVISQEPSRSITLRDQTGQIVVQNRQDLKVGLGQSITAIGYPFVRGTEAILRNAYIRSSAPNPAPPSSEKAPVFLRRLVGQVQTLSPEQAARGQPVRLTGMVTWVHPNTPFIYLQDATGGLRIDLSRVKPPKPNLYDYGVVDGETLRGDFTAEATASTFGIRGRFDLPAARLITLDHAMTGVEEGNWVELQGYVNAVTSRSPWLDLSVTTSSGEFAVRLPPEFTLNNVVGSIVRIKGICTAITNAAGLLTGIRIWVPEPECILEDIAAPRDRFALPESMISSLRRFNQLAQSTKQIRVTGRIIDQKAGHFIRLQNGNDVLTVLTSDTHPYHLGDRVEAVGIAGRSAGHLVLRNGVSRFIAAGPPHEPLNITNFSTINESLYGRIVQIEGRLLEVTHNEDECLMFLQIDGKIVDAILENTTKSQTDTPVGSMLKLTGIYLIRYELNNPNEAIIRLRSENDIEIIARSPWWTVGRLLAAMGILLGVVLVVLGWVTALRRRVLNQTGLIRTQLEKEAFLQARHLDIVENASDFIYTLDLAGRFTSYNPAGQRLIGWHADDMLATHLRDHIAPEDAEQLVHLFQLDHKQDATANFQARFKHKDGRLIWTETSARIMRQQDEPTGYLAITRDIGQRKELEEQLRTARDTAEANTRSKSAFLANMSHEIRTPMNGVIGMSNLLLQTNLSDEQRDFSETIRNSADALLNILNDILDFSKIEAGKLQFDVADFELRQMVEETLELVASRASAKGLELASYLPPDLPNYMRGDPGRIRQVLLNLVGNAIKFTAKGEVTLSVSLEKETASDLKLRFEIADTGIGIPAEVQASLFQPFTQADNSTTRKYGGTGLGLVISKQIVELMHGEIGVHSAGGLGSTFWFTINIEKQPFNLPREEPVKVTALNGLRTLIVDDSATNRKIIQRYTVAWGMVSEQAHDGPSALLALRTAARANDPYRIVLLDYQMPGMDGIMLAHEIRKDPSLARPRTILLTSWDRRFSREELNDCGIIRMLVKPIRQQDLLGALLRCIRTGLGTHDSLQDRTTQPPEPNEPTLTTKTGAHRILVAEDNIVNQRVSVHILKNLGYTADLAANGLEVLEAVKRQRYDVIFMDGQMPELDGYETTRRLRADPLQRHLYIVAMTANAMHGDRERCLRVGMDDYISKPARPSDLSAALERADTVLKKNKPPDFYPNQ